MTTRSNHRRLPPPIVFVVLGLILLITLPKVAPWWRIWQPSDPRSPSSTQSLTLEDRLSLGEKLLVAPVATAAKQEGVAAFASNAKQLWGGEVNWRTASAYDATKALIAGLQQNSSRDGLQAVLRNPNFSAVGASSKVQFLATGDRVGEIVLVKAVVNQRGHRFSRLEP